MVILHDVTARNLAIKQLERSREEQLRVKSEFLSHVSHELRTPLTAIDQFVTILLDGLAGAITEEQRAYLGIAHRNAGQLRDMIENLVQAARTQSGKFDVEPRELSVMPILDDVAETLGPTATEKGLTLNVEAAPDLPAVFADPHRSRQIVMNLLHNALKFTPAGGQVTLAAARCQEDEAFLQISVRDTGCGISPEDCGRIFDQLYQVKSSLGQNRTGLGLGLFISRDLVIDQGGRIWVESELGRGAKFNFTLPLPAPDQILRHAIERGLASARKQQSELSVLLFKLDWDAFKTTSVAGHRSAVTMNNVWEALARQAGERCLKTAFSGCEFIVLDVSNNNAEIALQEKTTRVLKDVLFQAAPDAVGSFSCGAATRKGVSADATELLASVRCTQLHEHERIGAKYIVIVDDDNSVRRVLHEAVKGIGVRHIVEASSGIELLAMLDAEVPDLILLDLQMPGMNGYEAIGRLKKHARTADIPILVLSGDEVEIRKLQSRSPKSSIPVLAKPLEFAALTQYVSYLL